MTKLNIGCGKHNLGNDWIHIDGEDYPHIEYHNLRKIPLEDNSVDLIYSSHTIEYFDRQEIKNILKEWKRLLKTGAKLQLVVPNFDTIASLRCLGIPLEEMEMTLFGRMKMNQNLIYHKTCWNKEELSNLLTSLGFCNIKNFSSKSKLLNFGTIITKRILWNIFPRRRGQLMSLYLEGEKEENHTLTLNLPLGELPKTENRCYRL